MTTFGEEMDRYKMSKQQGFTLLELLVTLAILVVVTTVGIRTTLNNKSSAKSAQNTATMLKDELSLLKDKALSMNTTARMVITNTGGIYTMNTYTSSAPTSACTAAGTWTLVISRTLDVNSKYQITGTGLSNLCFYRDGSSSGGIFIVSPIVATAETKTTTIDVIIATGFLDVSTN
ncbi:MAG: hypothetical protein K0R98_504 [Rickettsiaceae bacterium]|jgi:prepilin-type N-terminal cleavage/methylation domain-containing protein|nr:hypothetical protein [Rickettsiaceae bacterium]